MSDDEATEGVTVGMVTAALAAIGEFDVSLSSMRRREVTRMIQAALDWRAAHNASKFRQGERS